MTTLVAPLHTVQQWLLQYRRPVLAGLLLLALVYPTLASSYALSLAIELLIFAIFAMSLDLLLGYTGLPSLGHAAFFGLGAYLTAYLTGQNAPALGLTDNLLVTLPAVILGTALLALLTGLLALRTSGLYFLMITLAFAQMLYSIAIRWSGLTGGSDGLAGIPRPSIGLGWLSYSFDSRQSYYYLVLGCLALAWWLLDRIVNSPFGWTLRGIRENEPRLRALGYDTFRYKLGAFLIAGSLAGVAGLLLAHFFRHVSPDSLYWTTSGQVLMMVIIGGAGTLSGPMVGAMVVRLLPLLLSSYTDRWQTIIGLIFILFVLLAPQGILGFLRRERRRRL